MNLDAYRDLMSIAAERGIAIGLHAGDLPKGHQRRPLVALVAERENLKVREPIRGDGDLNVAARRLIPRLP